MSIFQLFRKPPQWLRISFAGLLLVFALNSIAHAAHTHEATAPAATHVACGYCATFGSIDAAPVYAHSLPTPTFTLLESPDSPEVRIARRPASAAQARAPPIH